MKAIVAMAKNGVIGNNNKLPWHLPDDLKWFKSQTVGGTIIMGKNTFLSLGSKPLKNRNNIVISSTLESTEGITVYRSIDEVPVKIKTDENTWIIGGAQLYQSCVGYCSDLYLTLVKQEYEGDCIFPLYGKLNLYFSMKSLVKNTDEYSIFHYENVIKDYLTK
jgi:dihydrofolate reductase